MRVRILLLKILTSVTILSPVYLFGGDDELSLLIQSSTSNEYSELHTSIRKNEPDAVLEKLLGLLNKQLPTTLSYIKSQKSLEGFTLSLKKKDLDVISQTLQSCLQEEIKTQILEEISSLITNLNKSKENLVRASRIPEALTYSCFIASFFFLLVGIPTAFFAASGFVQLGTVYGSVTTALCFFTYLIFIILTACNDKLFPHPHILNYQTFPNKECIKIILNRIIKVFSAMKP